MAKSETAIYHGRSITIEMAIALRDRNRQQVKGAFTCPECNHGTRPHCAGGHVPAHFEHLNRTGTCRLEHPL